jgi:hypothetical protein
MDTKLQGAIRDCLAQVERSDLATGDLLLIELDWGSHTPAPADEVVVLGANALAWHVVYSGSELIARRALAQAGRDRVALVYQGGNGLQLPHDLRIRGQGTLQRLGLQSLLRALTGRSWPPEVEQTAWRTMLERHLDALVEAATLVPGAGGSPAGLQWDVTRADLESMLVQAALGVPLAGRSAPQVLADLARAQRSTARPVLLDLELTLLHSQLVAHNIAAPEVIQWAVKTGQAWDLIRTGVMIAAEQDAQLAPNWGNLNSLRSLLINERQLAEPEARVRVIDLATAALPHLTESARNGLLAEAEQALAGVLPASSYNRWFRSALQYAIQDVAGRLVRDASVAAEVPRLRQHLAASDSRDSLDALDVLADLAGAWAAARSEPDSLSRVSEWADWYLARGSRLDLRALTLTRHLVQNPALSSTVTPFLNDYWIWRSELNARFARHYLDQYEAALHDREHRVFGVHRLLQWVVAPLLQSQARVLLLVIDGMSCPNFLRLMELWEQDRQPIFVQQVRPALSLLPTVTSVSRKALFMGKLPTDRLDDEEAYEQKARLTEEAGIKQALPGRTIRFYNKTNIGAAAELINDLQFRRAELVAVVLNEIDDGLKSPQTSVSLLRPEDIGPLVATVHAALTAGWAVLMTADHGHTWFRGKDMRIGDPGGEASARYGMLSPEAAIPKSAVETCDPNIARLEDGQRLALLTACGAYFSRVPHRGYHGGASLEEVVVPYALLTLAPQPRQHVYAQQQHPATGVPRTAAAPADHAGIVLTLRSGRAVTLRPPFGMLPIQIQLLQQLARLGEASEAQLQKVLNTRRIAGPLADLRDRLAEAGKGYDFIEVNGSGAGGVVYRFRDEML